MDSQDDSFLVAALEDVGAALINELSDSQLVMAANDIEIEYGNQNLAREMESGNRKRTHEENDLNLSEILDFEIEQRQKLTGGVTEEYRDQNIISQPGAYDSGDSLREWSQNRDWSQNAQEWIDNFSLDLLPQNTSTQSVQYGEGNSAQQPREPLFKIIRQKVEFYKRFQMQGTCYSLQISSPDPNMVPEEWLRQLLDGIISYFKNSSTLEIRSGDRIGMSLRNDECGTVPVLISFRRPDQMSGDVVMNHIMRIFNSNKNFFLNGHLTIKFDHIQFPHGSGRISRKFGETNSDFINNKACYIKYINPSLKNPEDEYCLPYALVISKAYAQYQNKEISFSDFRKYCRGYKRLRDSAEKMCKLAGVRMSKLRGGCSIDEVKKFQRVLTGYQIVIYKPDSKSPMYTDARYQGKYKLNIMLHQEHYLAMRSVKACFGARYICPECHTHTDTKSDHKCKYDCTRCQSNPKCEPTSDTVACTKCNRNFYGILCYMNHLKVQGKGKKSVCDTKKNCPVCFSPLEKKHVCGKRKCFTCEKVVDKDNHMCHMPKYETKRKQGNKYLYVMYDLETQQDTLLNAFEANKFKHVPNLCVSQSVCSTCIGVSDISIPCVDCGVREYIYNSTNCISNLMEYLVAKHNEKEGRIVDGKSKKVPKFDQIIVIAHNSSGFDCQFILKYIYDSDRFKNPSIIMNGTRLIEIKLDSRIKFIDSLIYFQRSLADLPQLFGFEGGKGYYPFLFNTPENENYKGSLPEKHFFGYDAMMPKPREKFEKWYDSISPEYKFDNKKELIEYCRMDVTILRLACIKFTTSFWEENHIDPFIDACTIAGACNKVFRSKYLKEDTIGVIPTNGYRLAENQSRDALKWLSLVEMEQNIEIQHAGRGREFKIPGAGRVDGYHAPSRTVLEYDGCYWHMCPTCYPTYLAGNTSSEEMRRRRDATLAKHKAITDAGYKLIVKKECDFKREMEECPAIDELLSHHHMVNNEPLKPRDAFFGGRTNANILYFKSDGITKMHYYDICSLYPFINKTSKTVLGHPKVHVGDDCLKVPWQNMDGLIKCTVSPPRGLAFPVLPSRMHHRLMFVLCNTCALNLYQCGCEHSEKERQLTGTWVLDEVKLAISKGYQIVKIHEIWEYQVTQYDPVTRTGGFFSEFINHFLKIKVEASSWPKWCKTVEQQDAYIKEFYDREGILLDRTKIEYNPALRSMAKLMLNSFWGRFGMRPDLLRTKLVQSGEELRDILLDPKIEVHSVLPINDDKMLLNYREKEEGREPNNTTNVVMAAFTTAYARMELYKYLDLLGNVRIYYFDTDSILFSYRDGEVMPELGDFLGQMTDELEMYGPGSFIIEFVSGGPKNYAYKVYTPSQAPYYSPGVIHTVVKVKGITLNYENSQIIDFELIKRMVVDQTEESVVLNNDGIRRTNVADVYTTRVQKTYRVNYTKRQKTGINHSTIPYGF